MENSILLKKNEKKLAIIEVPESLQSELDAIAKDARSSFITREAEGLNFRDRIYEELFVQVLEWERMHYIWRDGKEKEIRHNLTDQEAQELGYKLGADLRLRILNSDVEDEIAKLALPISSYVNFSRYCDHLNNGGITPKHVVTKLATVLKQFKVGKPQPVVTFTPVTLIQDWQRAASDKSTPQETVVEVEPHQGSEELVAEKKNEEDPPPVAAESSTIDNWT